MIGACTGGLPVVQIWGFYRENMTNHMEPALDLAPTDRLLHEAGLTRRTRGEATGTGGGMTIRSGRR